MAMVDRGEATLLSRNGADITRTFPEITAALPAAVGKWRIDWTYTLGLRSRNWIKTSHRLRSEFVIGGWLPGGVSTGAQLELSSSARTPRRIA
jgi:ATP-dependent DNA ligase